MICKPPFYVIGGAINGLRFAGSKDQRYGALLDNDAIDHRASLPRLLDYQLYRGGTDAFYFGHGESPKDAICLSGPAGLLPASGPFLWIDLERGSVTRTQRDSLRAKC